MVLNRPRFLKQDRALIINGKTEKTNFIKIKNLLI